MVDGDPEPGSPMRISIRREWKDRGGGWFMLSELRGTLAPQAHERTAVSLAMRVGWRTYFILVISVFIAIFVSPAIRPVIIIVLVCYITWMLYDAWSVRRVALSLWK